MSSDIANKLPIGWYLKEADSLITHFTNTTFEAHGINRFHWQVLKNIDKHEKISKTLYYHQVNRFLSEAELEEILHSLCNRNWVQHEGDIYSFTETGKRAYADIAALQDENHQKILSGTTPEEYMATINFLETIIRNMGGKI